MLIAYLKKKKKRKCKLPGQDKQNVSNGRGNGDSTHILAKEDKSADSSIPDFSPFGLVLFLWAPKGACLRMCIFENMDFVVCAWRAGRCTCAPKCAQPPREQMDAHRAALGLTGTEPLRLL